MINKYTVQGPCIYWLLLSSIACCVAVQTASCQLPPGVDATGESAAIITGSLLDADQAGNIEPSASTSTITEAPTTPTTPTPAAPTSPWTSQSHPDTASTQAGNQTSADKTTSAAETSRPQAVTVTETLAHRAGQSLLADLNLAACLPKLQQKAAISGFTAALIQPDANRPATFLVAAANQAAAGQLNGFFYWLADPDAGSPEQELLLGLDRLFTEAGREAAIASGLYRDSTVVSLLECALQLVLDERYQPDILTYILDNYSDDFRRRLEGQSDLIWSKQQTFQNLEVTYEASIYSCVTFRIQ